MFKKFKKNSRFFQKYLTARLSDDVRGWSVQDDGAFLNFPEIYYILALKMLFSPTYFEYFCR